MTSINKSIKGLNGDGWGTTLSKSEQLAHQNFLKELELYSYEDSREKEMAAFQKDLGLNPEGDRQTELNNMSNSSVNDIWIDKLSDNLDKLSDNIDETKSYIDEVNKSINKISDAIENIKLKHSQEIYLLNSKVYELEKKINELLKPGFITKIINFFSSFRK